MIGQNDNLFLRLKIKEEKLKLKNKRPVNINELKLEEMKVKAIDKMIDDMRVASPTST